MKKEEIKKPSSLGIINNRYFIEKILGYGYSGMVYKAIDHETNKIFAIKVFNEKGEKLFANESLINKKLSEIKSPFFIKYFYSSVGHFISKEKSEFKPFIIFEFCEKGDALNYFKSPLGERLSKIFFSKILQAVKALHNIGICHHDLKLNNFIFDGNFNLKLGDFGFSSLIEKKKNGMPKYQKIFAGTPHFKAPEVTLEKEYDGEKADIFSLGVILFNITFSKFGFSKFELIDNKSLNLNNNLYKFIKENKKELYWSEIGKLININDISEEFKDLYFRMVSFNPKQRPKIEEIYNHEWLKEIRDLNDEELKAYEEELINELKYRDLEINKMKETEIQQN